MPAKTFKLTAVGEDFSLSPPRLKATALQAVIIYYIDVSVKLVRHKKHPNLL